MTVEIGKLQRREGDDVFGVVISSSVTGRQYIAEAHWSRVAELLDEVAYGVRYVQRDTRPRSLLQRLGDMLAR